MSNNNQHYIKLLQHSIDSHLCFPSFGS